MKLENQRTLDNVVQETIISSRIDLCVFRSSLTCFSVLTMGDPGDYLCIWNFDNYFVAFLSVTKIGPTTPW